MCTSPTLSGISTLSQEVVSNLFGVSAQTDSDIRIWHYLYTLPEVIVPTSGVSPLQHFQVFLLLARKGVSTLWGLSSD